MSTSELPIHSNLVPPSPTSHTENNVFLFNEFVKLYYRRPQNYAAAFQFLETIVPVVVYHQITSGPKIRKVADGTDGYSLELCSSDEVVSDEAVVEMADLNMAYFFNYDDNYHGNPPRTDKLMNYNDVLKRFNIPYLFVPYHKTVGDQVQEAYDVLKVTPVSAEVSLEPVVQSCLDELKSCYSSAASGDVSKITHLMDCNTRLKASGSSYVFVPHHHMVNGTMVEAYELVQSSPLLTYQTNRDVPVSSMEPYAPDELWMDGKRYTFGPLSPEMLI